MIDFWTEFDKSYRLFSQFCDSDDWHRILRAVAGAVIHHVELTDCQLSLLDVGCGSGVASETICEQIYSQTRCFPSLSVVEPSSIARDRFSANILANADAGPLKHSFRTICEIPSDFKVDAILFLHSTYYLDDLEKELRRLVDSNLRPGGAVFTLVLPEQSPFFLGIRHLNNCSDAVESIFRALSLKTDSFELKSRFILPRNGALTDAEADRMRKFFMPNAPSCADFKSRLREYSNADGLIDFRDHLLIGKKKMRQ